MADSPEPKYPMTGIILSGGKSLRMGEDKAFIHIDGLPIIKRICTLFTKLFDEIIIVANQKEPFLDLNAKIYVDLLPGRGVLGGLYTGLYFSSHTYSFCVASDMPYLKESIIEHLIQNAGDEDVIVPRTADGLQPLHALYSKNCLQAAERMMKKENYKIIDFYPIVRVKVIEEEDFLTLDPLRESFININTPQELISVRNRRTMP